MPANLVASAKQQWRRGSNSKVSSGSSNANIEAAKVAAPSLAAVPTKVTAPAHQSQLKRQRRSSCNREGISRTTVAGMSIETGAAGPAKAAAPANSSSSKGGTISIAEKPAKAAAVQQQYPQRQQQRGQHCKRQKHMHRCQYRQLGSNNKAASVQWEQQQRR